LVGSFGDGVRDPSGAELLAGRGMGGLVREQAEGVLADAVRGARGVVEVE
jgi:hypothetical protein